MSTEVEESLSAKAARLAIEAVKAVAALHTVEMLDSWGGKKAYCSACWNDCGQLMWPCPTVELLSEAEEAINEWDEDEERIANGPYHCPALVFPAGRDNPAEYCEEEVPNEGDLCARHDREDRDEAQREDRAYDEWKDSRYAD